MKHFLTIIVNGNKLDTIQLNNIPAFGSGRLTIGRSEDNDIVIPYAAVSRHHAVIEIRGNGVDIVDAGSLNKLRVNGTAYERIRMANGTKVVIGTSMDNVTLCYNTIDDMVQNTVYEPASYTERQPTEETNVRRRERENVRINFAPRLFAFLADLTICMFMSIGSAVIMLFFFGKMFGSMKLMAVFTALVTMFVTWLYCAIGDSGESMGTLGKTILGICVADRRTGRRISFAQASKRYFAKILSTLILFLGYLPIYGKNQTLHDKIAGTAVIKNPRT